MLRQEFEKMTGYFPSQEDYDEIERAYTAFAGDNMIRGTTPTLTITLSNELDFESYFVTFRQEGYIVIEKTETDCTREGKVITVPLSQDDTLKLRSGVAVEIQVRGKIGGQAYATSIKKIYAEDILKEGKI